MVDTRRVTQIEVIYNIAQVGCMPVMVLVYQTSLGGRTLPCCIHRCAHIAIELPKSRQAIEDL